MAPRQTIGLLVLVPALQLLLGWPNAALGGTTHNPNLTATIYVHGGSADGPDRMGVYGDHVPDSVLDDIAGLVGMPTINQPGGILNPDVAARTTYYGDTPPPYYTAQDIADVDAVTAQWGGGIPRYAVIVAKYAKYVMEQSGAQQVNFVSGSMGSLVTRWLIEKNVEGLAGDGRIARWLTLEGIVSGNWFSSKDLIVLFILLSGSLTIDIEHMDYAWVEQNLHSPRTEADDAVFSSILIGQVGATQDTANDGLLTTLMLLWGEFQGNDGVQGVLDMIFQTVTPQSRFLNLTPTLTFHHVNHYQLGGYPGTFAQAATFLTQRRRVVITMTRAQVTDIHEPEEWTPAEVVFQNRVYSPEVASQWGITDPLSSRHRAGATAPTRGFDHSGQEQVFSEVIFDDFVMDTETQLDLELWAEEIDRDVRYGVTETFGEPAVDDLGGACITVPITGPGTYPVSSVDWNADITVAIIDYPFARFNVLGDIDGDGSVNYFDLLALVFAWGPCPAPPTPCPADLDGDGVVGFSDLEILVDNWGSG